MHTITTQARTTLDRQHSCTLQAALVQTQAAMRQTAAAEATLAVLRDQQQAVHCDIERLQDQINGAGSAATRRPPSRCLQNTPRDTTTPSSSCRLSRRASAIHKRSFIRHSNPLRRLILHAGALYWERILVCHATVHRAAAAEEEAARLEAEAAAMESQAVLQRQELHRLRMALRALCSTAPATGRSCEHCTTTYCRQPCTGAHVQPGSIMLQQDVHCHVQSVARGNVHVQQHTIHAARTVATPPSANSNSGRWHIDRQQGVVTVVNISPEPPVNARRHEPVTIAPVRECVMYAFRWWIRRATDGAVPRRGDPHPQGAGHQAPCTTRNSTVGARAACHTAT